MKPERYLLEQLEPRIAPAVLVNGANLLGGGQNPTTGEMSTDENAYTAIKVSAGTALVWFDAVSESITGISVSQGANIEVWGNVKGDIVANLTSAGRLSDSDSNPTNGEDGNVLLPNDLAGITIHSTLTEEGNVHDIITGGNIANVNVEGKISGIYAGNGVYNSASTVPAGGTFSTDVATDVNPLDGISNTSFTFDSANFGVALKSGASINNTKINNGIELQIIAGSGFDIPGGTGGAGGSVNNVSIESAAVLAGHTTSYFIAAGDGGTGLNGGIGGSITSVVENASSQDAIFHAGNGGDGTAGNGGNGGAISKINAQSDQTSYFVTGGFGGEGTINGGNGGSLSQNNFSGHDPKTGIMLAGNFIGDSHDDILVVDAGSGQMVLMGSANGGTSYSPVVQVHDPADPNDDNDFINPVGVTPKAAVAGDFNGDGQLDFAIAYGNSSSVGIFLNTNGQFVGHTFTVGLAPTDITVGHYVSGDNLDIAILANTGDGATMLLAHGNGTGDFSLLSTTVDLGKTKNALDMVSTTVGSSGLDTVFVGYSNGQIKTLTATGLTTNVFQVSANIANSVSNLSNLDVDPSTSKLLAFSSKGKAISLFDYSSGGLVPTAGQIDLTTLGGQATVARFGGLTDGNVQILTSQSGVSKINEYAVSAVDGSFGISRTISGDQNLKTFISTDGGAGVAALAGSLNRLEFNISGNEFTDIGLPFSGKAVEAISGSGGTAGTGKGGAGGVITSLNIEADTIAVTTGTGGDSASGSAGAGGAFTNTGSISLASGVVAVALAADTSVNVVTGGGGNSLGGLGAGGAGGAISGLTASVKTGDIDITTGNGGSAVGGNSGAGGSTSNLTLTNKGGDLLLTLGNGGTTTGGTIAGNGGGVTNFKYSQDLDKDTDALGLGYAVNITGGSGGDATMGKAGNAGSFFGLTINIDPSDINTDAIFDLSDGTTTVVLLTANGGTGALGGGNGGNISNVVVQVNLDQVKVDPLHPNRSYVVPNFATLEVVAGGGGDGGLNGNGGLGGSITGLKAKSITQYDVDSTHATEIALQLFAGDGGDGGLAGGNGGGISNFTSSNGLTSNGGTVKTNWLTAAQLIAGSGGDGGAKDGGAGGSIVNARAGVQESLAGVDPRLDPNGVFLDIGGQLFVTAGAGGESVAGKGGVGGSITSGAYASVSVATMGFHAVQNSIVMTSGDGGNGALIGGAGGSLGSFTVNSPQQEGIFGSVLFAGNGGDANAVDALAKAGMGGSISAIKQQKDLNSSMSVLQSGNGGSSSSGTGGNGGSVTSVNSTGFIGLPMEGSIRIGVMDVGMPQGIFAGLGGSGGLMNGFAGTIANIVARQISALGGSMLQDGTFGLAKSITNVKADVIGYDVNNDGVFQGPGSPTVQAPVDGFLLAQTISGIQTYDPARTAAFSFTA